jgi:hypothetical protein
LFSIYKICIFPLKCHPMNKKEKETIFSRGGAPWSVKYYKEKVLSALTADLARRELEGIDEAVCKKIYGALSEAITLVSDIKDGGYFFKHFYEHLEEFKGIYYQWNGVKNDLGRRNFHIALRKKKNSMFASFYKKMKKVNEEEHNRQFEILYGVEAERMDRLNHTFMRLVKDHGVELFSELNYTLAQFNKARGKWKKNHGTRNQDRK